MDGQFYAYVKLGSEEVGPLNIVLGFKNLELQVHQSVRMTAIFYFMGLHQLFNFLRV